VTFWGKQVQEESRPDEAGRVATAVIAVGTATVAALATHDPLAKGVAALAAMIAVCRAGPTGAPRVIINAFVAAALGVLDLSGLIADVTWQTKLVFAGTLTGIIVGDLLRIWLVDHEAGAATVDP
jgi:hypothetical protein